MLELEKRLRKRTRLFAGVLSVVVLVIGVMIIRHVKSAGHVSVLPDVILSQRIRGTMASLQTSASHTSFVLDEIQWKEDKNGFFSQPRAQLLADDEQTGLLLYDRNGQVRVQLVVTHDQPKLVLLDKNGNAVFSAP